jgi:acetyl esterase/lipase
MVREMLAVAPLFGDPEDDGPIDVAALRENIDMLAGSLALPEAIRREARDLGGVPTDVFTPDDARPGAVLYLHGGGYVIGSRVSHGGIAGNLAAAARRRTALPDYRLGPEHPFPAAVDDAIAAYRALLEDHPARQLAVAGDSAGGGLTLATLLALRDRGIDLPATAVCLSPWTDLRCTTKSMRTRADVDPICRSGKLRHMADLYLGGADPATPLASPALADFTGLPPLLLQVGDAEVLLDDSIAVERRARAAGVDVELEVWDDMVHVFQAFVGLLPDAQRAMDRIGAHLDRHLS